MSYKRLTRTITVPAGGGHLSFWSSWNTEPEWDHMFVEAHTPGSDSDWTTLPDLNGNTTTSTGQSCPAGWNTLHPQLDHYQTVVDDNDLHRDRHDGRVERGQRQLGRLEAVGRRPFAVGRQAGRGLDLLRQ